VPELPEVETSRLGLLPHLLGNTIERVIVRNASLRWPVPPQVGELRTARVLALGRRGKYLLFDLAEGQLLLHLGMSGSLRVVDQAVAPGKHDHVDFCLADGKCLRLTDPRRFGAVLWNTQGLAHPLLAHLGMEPLDVGFDGAFLARKAEGRHQAVKTFIMDAKMVVGVGNIYAQESLFLAGIHPQRSVNRISAARWQRLADAIQQVLRAALAAGGTSLRDFIRTDGKPGYFKQELKVYGRDGLPCYRCGTPIRLIRQGQRSTCYCPRCQH
jgi:formamidopyrimidine-DNA glycosylase